MNRHYSPTARSLGFTLVELLVSIALVLVLILGINQVFGLTSKTVGAGQAFSSVHRDARATPNILYNDARGIALDSTLFIRSERVDAYRNRQDRDTDLDGNVGTFDPTHSGAVADERGFRLSTLTQRNHRTDVLGFFSRGSFTKQTGAGTAFVDVTGTGQPVTSTEAWIWYGHLRLPNPITGTSPQPPGYVNATSHDAATFATNWYLGRMAVLLNPTPPNTYGYVAKRTSGQTLTVLCPNGSNPDIGDSQFDMAATSIEEYKRLVADQLAAATSGSPYQYWDHLSSWRFYGNPIPLKPLDSLGAAQAVPCYLRACTQFVVEFAGDFTTQDPATGNLVVTTDPTTSQPASNPDGIVDFDIEAYGPNPLRRTRWYGFPRLTRAAVTNNDTPNFSDVLPLYYHLKGAGINTPRAFEKVLTSANTPSGALNLTDQYIVAWGPDAAGDGPKPSMLRVTITLDDPGNRLSSGQTFEYVIKLR